MKSILSVCIAWALLISSAVAQVQNPGVVGPNSSVNGHVAIFSGTSGKFIADGGNNPGTVTSVTCFGSAITTSGTCTMTGQIPGTTTNDNATAGNVGEYMESISGTVGMTNSTNVDVATLSLTAGDWDVWANNRINIGSGATMTAANSWINTTSATFPSTGRAQSTFAGSLLGDSGYQMPTGTIRISVASTTTVYLSAVAAFSGGTVSSVGVLMARRAR